jgi:hypothetical protein
MTERVLLCTLRSLFILVGIVVVITGVKYLGWEYEDLRVGLGIFKAYFPEMVALASFVGVAMVFYRASVAKSDFNFIYFFISKPGVHEDVSKLVFFLLGITSINVIYTLLWRSELDATILGLILTVFILERGAAIAGKVFGKPRPEDPKPEEKEEGKG